MLQKNSSNILIIWGKCRMAEKELLSIAQLLGDGEEAETFNSVTKEIEKETAEKLYSLPEQADNWNALANQVVGAKHS